MARAVFMGSDSFSVPILEALLRDGPGLSVPVEVCGVVTQPDRPAGRGRRISANPVKELAGRHGLAVLQPERVRERAAVDAVLALRPDVIVVASFGQLLPRPLLERPPHGCLNLHPSLLPRYRGPAPVVETILCGETETGTTLMLVSPKMDAGPILAQERVPVRQDETAGELEARLALLSATLLMRELPSWFLGRISPQPQDDSRSSYTHRVTKDAGLIDWRQSAESLARQVRAYNPWPVAFTFWADRQLRLLRARHTSGAGEPGQVLGMRDESLAVGAGEGILLIRDLQLAGGRRMSAPDLAHGYPGLLSARLSAGERWS